MLVQLVCLDRRYQRMNCYNIREIQTILKSKYTPNTVDTSDVRFSLNDTTIGLRYQLGGLDFINNSILTFYQNTLFSTSPYTTVHSILNKPLVEFESINNFMNKASNLYKSLVFTKDQVVNPTSFDVSFIGNLTNVLLRGTQTLFSVISDFIGNVLLSFSSPVLFSLESLISMDLKTLPLSLSYKIHLDNPGSLTSSVDFLNLTKIETTQFNLFCYAN